MNNAENKCLFCGHVIEPRKTNRGKEPYYHTECKKARNFFDAFQRATSKIECITPEQARLLRGDLFAMANVGMPPKKPQVE